jgi:N-acetylneuraminate synthase
VKIDDNEFVLKEGQTIRIPPNSVHEFWTANGAIIEELSTKHIASDSFYIDNEINSSQNRKSFITYWKPRA